MDELTDLGRSHIAVNLGALPCRTGTIKQHMQHDMKAEY